MRLLVDFNTAEDTENSGTVSAALLALVDLMVDLELTEPDSYGMSGEVYVVRVDDDGDLVVCEVIDGVPWTNATVAIPQDAIKRITVPLGAAA